MSRYRYVSKLSDNFFVVFSDESNHSGREVARSPAYLSLSYSPPMIHSLTLHDGDLISPYSRQMSCSVDSRDSHTTMDAVDFSVCSGRHNSMSTASTRSSIITLPDDYYQDSQDQDSQDLDSQDQDGQFHDTQCHDSQYRCRYAPASSPFFIRCASRNSEISEGVPSPSDGMDHEVDEGAEDYDDRSLAATPSALEITTRFESGGFQISGSSDSAGSRSAGGRFSPGSARKNPNSSVTFAPGVSERPMMRRSASVDLQDHRASPAGRGRRNTDSVVYVNNGTPGSSTVVSIFPALNSPSLGMPAPPTKATLSFPTRFPNLPRPDAFGISMFNSASTGSLGQAEQEDFPLHVQHRDLALRRSQSYNGNSNLELGSPIQKMVSFPLNFNSGLNYDSSGGLFGSSSRKSGGRAGRGLVDHGRLPPLSASRKCKALFCDTASASSCDTSSPQLSSPRLLTSASPLMLKPALDFSCVASLNSTLEFSDTPREIDHSIASASIASASSSVDRDAGADSDRLFESRSEEAVPADLSQGYNVGMAPSSPATVPPYEHIVDATCRFVNSAETSYSVEVDKSVCKHVAASYVYSSQLQTPETRAIAESFGIYFDWGTSEPYIRRVL
jgi:hypothetical protein